MTPDQEMRLECLRVSAARAGNPNTIQQAQEFYEFVRGAYAATPTPPVESNITKAQQSRQKGSK